MDIKEKSLRLALEATGSKELPKAFNENGLDFWIKAIGLVRKLNCTQSYCLLRHRPDGVIEYTNDFGLPSPIFGLLSVHPYIFLDKTAHYPVYASREVMYDDLSREYGLSYDDIRSCSEEQLEAYRIGKAIRRQELANDAANNPLIDSSELIEHEDVDSKISVSPESEMDEDGMITLLSASDVKDENGNFVNFEETGETINDGKSEHDDIVGISAQPVKERGPILAAKRRGRPRKNDSKTE